MTAGRRPGRAFPAVTPSADHPASADPPFPDPEGRLPVERVAGVLERPADLAAVVRLVRDDVAEEGDGVRLEALDLAAGDDGLAEEFFNLGTGRGQGAGELLPGTAPGI